MGVTIWRCACDQSVIVLEELVYLEAQECFEVIMLLP